ncbi:MAG TPA: isocitrate lyase/phosphoenolpyruvate mutase family protein [Stackebrandtia sp.]|uniref:isocitrate lyase/PEP mutase family protein n=1 Tax=Stackebrandtia sp. TaxID=2023065 RepID=UPI002D653579|nr:isocitrate lyase/phosphoenolpyruvate mutase family protein [Stackebrandtia sp.]HZE37831.1 isocitrate lyase/phosphoenolpyruvate mutase family protein [Stackebrandtia sp.]
MTTIQEKAERFHQLHSGPRPLLLANAWDGASARIVEDAGAEAIATTSAGVAWTLGAADGDQLRRELAIEAVARIAGLVGVPVTADIERGFAETAKGVGETVSAIIAAGAVGVNIEDSTSSAESPLRTIEEQAERLSAARAAAEASGVNLYINARTDTYLRAVGEESTRFDATVERARAYLAAGASGVFVPGVVDLATVGALSEAIDGPLNIMVGPGAPSAKELGDAGAARLSLGAAIAMAAYALTATSAREFLDEGTYSRLSHDLDFMSLNGLLAK